MFYRQVTEQERYLISHLAAEGKSTLHIAGALRRHRSTIARELGRNRNTMGHYKPLIAHEMAVARRRESRRNTRFGEQDWALSTPGRDAAPAIKAVAEAPPEALPQSRQPGRASRKAPYQ